MYSGFCNFLKLFFSIPKVHLPKLDTRKHQFSPALYETIIKYVEN